VWRKSHTSNFKLYSGHLLIVNNLFPIELAEEFHLCQEAFQDNITTLVLLERAQDRAQTLLRMKPESVEKVLAFWPMPVFTEVGVVPLCRWQGNEWD
jgi:hypothetical protein